MEDTAKIRQQEIIGLLRREYGNLTGNERQEVADRIEALTADNERLQARVAELEDALRWVDDAISWEINPSNYDHGEVCEMNAKWCEIGQAARAALKETDHD